MHSDDLSEFHFDLEERNQTRRAMDARAARLGRLFSGRHCSTQGARTVRADRIGSTGRLGDGAAAVAVSPAEKWGWLR